jgi:hypothetical protein
MPAIRTALRMLRELNLELWTEAGRPTVTVDGGGRIHVRRDDDSVESLQATGHFIPICSL